MNQMFRFYNCNGSFVRAAMFASCPVLDSSSTLGCNEMNNVSNDSSLNQCGRDEIDCPFIPEKNLEINSTDIPCGSSNLQGIVSHLQAFFKYISQSVLWRFSFLTVNEKDGDDASDVSEASDASADTEFSDDDELCVQEDKFLIFTTGSNTYSPHQIG